MEPRPLVMYVVDLLTLARPIRAEAISASGKWAHSSRRGGFGLINSAARPTGLWHGSSPVRAKRGSLSSRRRGGERRRVSAECRAERHFGREYPGAASSRA